MAHAGSVSVWSNYEFATETPDDDNRVMAKDRRSLECDALAGFPQDLPRASSRRSLGGASPSLRVLTIQRGHPSHRCYSALSLLMLSLTAAVVLSIAAKSSFAWALSFSASGFKAATAPGLRS